MGQPSAGILTAFERWASEGRDVCAPPLDRFEVGDWLARCPDRRRGCVLAGELTGVAYGTLRSWRWVAASVPAEIRRPDLSFRHHRAVASYDRAEQDRRLALAASLVQGWGGP